MHPIIENFLERPRSHKVLFWAVSHAIIFFLAWQYMIAPTRKELTKVEEKVTTLKTQIVTERRIVNDLEKYRKEVVALNAQYEIAQKRLPEKRAMPDLLASVARLAKDSGLEVLRFAPKPDVVKEHYAELPVEIEMRGTFHKVATFFDELSRLSRIVNVRDIALTNPRGASERGGVDIDVKGALVTFRYLEPEERRPAGDSEDGKTQKGKRKSPEQLKTGAQKK